MRAFERDHSDLSGRGRASVPIVPIARVSISQTERARIDAMAEKLRTNDPALGRFDVFGPMVSPGLNEGPALLFGDQREMAMTAEHVPQKLEHRMALLGRRGDVLAVEQPADSFRAWLEQTLPDGACGTACLGPPAPGLSVSLPARCLREERLLADLVRRARAAGHLQIIPHIGTGWTWVLAATIAKRSRCPVSVAAPPPRLVRRVNDKLWFAQRVREVLDLRALPPSYAAYGPAAAAGHLRRLAGRAERLVLKVPDGSGGEGNISIAASEVRARPAARLRDMLLTTLRSRGWNGRFPLLVGVWDIGATSSPSVQLWIPSGAQGDPVIDGFFEQRVEGGEGAFVGAAPAELPPALSEKLASEAMKLALLFQRLGYFGRCSFDALVIGRDRPNVHWIECNGRWGGVSIPLVLARRLRGEKALEGLAIIQSEDVPLSIEGFDGAIAALGDLVFTPSTGRGIVPLSSGMFKRGRGVHFAALAEDQVAAEHLAARGFGRLAANGDKS